MSDHVSAEEGPWPAGWAVAAGGAIVSAILARWLGDAAMLSALLVGLVVFVVFGVLLGMFWAAPLSHAGHGHGVHHDHVVASAPVAVPQPVALPQPVAPIATVAPVAREEAPQLQPVTPQPFPPQPSPVMPQPGVAADAPQTGVAPELRPAALSGPRGGLPDDLQVIEGIGPALAKQCNDLGIFHYDQIAAWGAGEVAWMDGNLKGFKGRVSRDKWVRQARLIGEVGVEEFKRRAKSNDY